MAEAAQWQAKAGPYLGEISALAFLHLPAHLSSSFPLLLAGTGSQVLAYDVGSRRLLCSFHAFHGVRVHGLALRSGGGSSSEEVVAVYGERRVKLLRVLVDWDGREVSVGMEVCCGLPRFDHWVLDATFIEAGRCLVAGLSDNSVAVWDVVGSKLRFRVKAPERCLLYSMRLWGEDVEALCVASGTIYNEIIVWKLGGQTHLSGEDSSCLNQSCCDDFLLSTQCYMPIHLCTFTGHNGSIFRMAWSSDGSKLLSVSDDRSARIWIVDTERQDNGALLMHSATQVLDSLALFGHDARIWDCYISDQVIITAGEDCTCRVWGMDGNQILMLKEHTGRGIWRCLYDPGTSVLVTAGFDSAIQMHLFSTSSCKSAQESDGMLKDRNDRTDIFSISIPNASDKLGLTDSKSEYVRCLHFRQEDVLYVATNNGYLYHAKFSNLEDVRWTELARISEEVPIICMDLMATNLLDSSVVAGDMIALGDGKGNATVVRVINTASSPKVALSFTWLAERERQLLGIHWCKSLGYSYLFTADPRGTLKLWRVEDASKCVTDTDGANANLSPIAVFSSCFGARILCLDASMEDELLVCGDLRGNLVIFPLSNDMLVSNVAKPEQTGPLLTHFKGAHGISSVTGILIGRINVHQIELRTTGGDGCICYFNYDRNSCTMEFLGMKHVKELSVIQGIVDNSSSMEDLERRHCAIGFASTDFIIWNLMNESKILKVPCGGWRRPYSYCLGDIPEIQNCFAFLKDHKIHIHRLWELPFERQLFPQIMHMQCHGREIHSSCFISFQMRPKPCQSKHLWVATGSEDGTVRLTRYTHSNLESWSASLLLGEHVGGSAVRSLCFITKTYTYETSQRCIHDGPSVYNSLLNKDNYEFLLISVGAKQVLTSWLLRDQTTGRDDESCVEGSPRGSTAGASMEEHPSISFQWLSTHLPPKLHRTCRTLEVRLRTDKNKDSSLQSAQMSQSHLIETINGQTKSLVTSENDNDWRYLAVTAFLVEGADYRSKVCFVVVASSDATLTLRALLLPHRLWFDVALLVSQTSPVLALRHVVVPIRECAKCNAHFANAYIIVSGSTDGTITLWDLTETVEQFMQSILELPQEKLNDCQRRPRTGRGSQGGRWWKSLNNYSCKKGVVDASNRTHANLHGHNEPNGTQSCETLSELASKLDSSQICQESADVSQSPLSESNTSTAEICELQPLHVLRSVHQSGVNCLHVSKLMQYNDLRPGSVYCVVSGGDDQALNCFFFDFTAKVSVSESSDMQPIRDFMWDTRVSQPPSSYSNPECFEGLRHINGCFHSANDYRLRVLHRFKVDSAHNSAVKGVWTDGSWVFSTGLDQRIRFWHIADGVKLIERAHLIVSVPEPESLDAVNYDSSQNRYQIVVTGRGMQMVEFSP